MIVELKQELLELLNSYDEDNFQKGYLEVQNLILTYKVQFSKDETSSILSKIYSNLNDEIKEELLGDIIKRLHGFCSPKDQIPW